MESSFYQAETSGELHGEGTESFFLLIVGMVQYASAKKPGPPDQQSSQ